MRQCFKCNEKFPDTETQCPLCGHTRSFAIAGTTRITRKPLPATAATPVAGPPTPAAMAPAATAPLTAPNPATWSYQPPVATTTPADDGEWHPSGFRWAGITIVGILFPPLAAISFLGTETIFLLIIQWMAVLFGSFLIFELAWAEWLGGAFALFTLLKEVRGGLFSLAQGHWMEFLLAVLVCVGLGLALVMLRQGYAHPGTRKLVYPAVGLMAVGLLLVFAGALSVHQMNGEMPDLNPTSAHDQKTLEALKMMEETLHPPDPPAQLPGQ